ncbi:MAG: flagellin [Armatimonadota bacterium]|jgi:flagellar hook-associated protein 3 FlgL
MRVSTFAYNNDTKQSLARAQQDLRRLSRQLSSGKRLTRPSDDPVSVGAIINARSDLANVINQQKVLQRAQTLTGPADAALGNMASALRQVRDIALGASQPGLTDAARRSQAQIVRSHCNRIMDEANISVQNVYLFAGKLSQTKPFVESPAGVEYTGDSEGVQVWVAPERPLEVTIPGDHLFNFEGAGGTRPIPEVDTDLYALLNDLANAIEAGDEARIPELAADLDALYGHVVEQRGVLGAKVQRINDATDSALDAEVAAREILSDTEDIDIVTALVDLQHQQLCYQAALAATAKLAQLPTLFELQW